MYPLRGLSFGAATPAGLVFTSASSVWSASRTVWPLSRTVIRGPAHSIVSEDMRGVFLIEEPENGIHPKAMETIIQSLTSTYHGQVLIATHSPVVINQLEAKQVLCFAKDAEGATDIIAGNLHPA
jgi:predicted ATP-dependent endonuclease of OLD family